MKTKSKTSIFIAFATALITFACLGGTPATSTPADPTDEPIIPTEQVRSQDGKLEITNTSSYIDSFNDYNVSGEIVNNTNDAFENVTLSLSVTDETGASLLKDENDNPVESIDFQPYISVLAPNTASPFNYYIPLGEIKPANYEVSIKSYDPSFAPAPIQYDIKHVQTTIIGDDVVITGEVVNLTSKQMDVKNLAGALLDDKNNVLAANSTLTYTRYLYPAGDSAGRDRGPFAIKLFGPLNNIAQWKVYARPVENWTTPSVDMNLQMTGSYFDSYGTYHMLGTLTNNGANQISPSVIGSLQNQSQTILDTASLNIPFYLNTGETTAFDIYTFQVVDSMPDTEATAEKSITPDLYWTFTTSYQTISLEQGTLKVNKDDYGWKATGKITNTSSQELYNINTLIECLDADNQPMVVNYTAIYPESGNESIEPGVTLEFSADLYPPANTENLGNCHATFQGISAE